MSSNSLVGEWKTDCCRASESVASNEPVEIKIYPRVRRKIDGIGALDRTSLFAMCDQGGDFDRRIRSSQRMSYLLKDLGATFGRLLGPIRSLARNPEIVQEDAQRPGFVDLKILQDYCQQRQRNLNKAFARFVDGRLDIAAHGVHNAFPDFMGQFSTPQSTQDPKHSQHLPDNLDAAAELSAAALEYNYNDFDRPAYYEPINEPHWSFTSDKKLADWHVKTRDAIQTRGLNLQVGGPCNSVAYFYRNNYKAFDGLKNFIDNTDCELDFYSFHVYDYLNWDGQALVGRITSGLPLEGVLDLVQNYTHNEFGKQKKIVISEHGGYITGSSGRPNAEKLGELLAAKYFPDGEGFEHVIRKRSIESHVLVSAAIANTLTFMDHPHVIQKAVPFIIPETMGWDPKYYPTLYVPNDFTDREDWIETRNIDFYKFFRDLKGERVIVTGGDPDLQVRAFAHDDQLMIVINNLSDESHATQLKFPSPLKIELRRYGRNRDYTPYLTEENMEALKTLELAGREAVLIKATYSQAIPTKSTFNEIPCYGSTITVQPTQKKPARFLLEVPDLENLAYATLRIGVTRPHNAEPNLRLKINGKTVTVPLEDAATRLVDSEKEYASTKIVSVDRSILRKKNRVEVFFPDDQGGTIGSVVLRAGMKE